MAVGLVVVLVGGFWTLAYIPISDNQKRLEQQLNELRNDIQHHYAADDAKYLTQKEHNEFKTNVIAADDRHGTDIAEIKKIITSLRTEVMTRSDAQQLLNTTRVEFLAEVKRLDQLELDNMKRKEFDVWQKEREKTIGALQDRQNRFSEALDSMYSRIMQQMPSYQQKQ